MDKPVIPIPPSMGQSPLIPAAAALYFLAAITGIPGIVLLADPEYRAILLRDLMSGGITDPASLRSFQLINGAVTIFACIGPAVMAAGLLISRRGRPVQGINLLSDAAQWTLYGVNGSGMLCLIIFVFRFFRALLGAEYTPNGVVSIYSMVISEALMVTQAVFLFCLIRRFLNCCIDSTASIAYSFASGKLDDRSIPGFAATGFLILAILGTVLAGNGIFTITAVINPVHSYYKLLVAGHPGAWIEGICLLLGSAANVLMYQYLRRYKRMTERALYNARSR